MHDDIAMNYKERESPRLSYLVFTVRFSCSEMLTTVPRIRPNRGRDASGSRLSYPRFAAQSDLISFRCRPTDKTRYAIGLVVSDNIVLSKQLS